LYHSAYKERALATGWSRSRAERFRAAQFRARAARFSAGGGGVETYGAVLAQHRTVTNFRE